MSIQPDGTSVASRPTSVSSAVGFRDSAALTKWLRSFLWLGIATSVVSLALGLLELKLLTGIAGGEDLTAAATERSEWFRDILALPQVFVLIATIVMFAIWVYRANYNARQLGASGMAFSPGWSVGWYFIPIANLWKPYQAMSEIWKASAAPSHWQEQPRGSILPWWWACFLLSNVLGYAAFRSEWRAQTPSELLIANSLWTITDAGDIVSNATALVLVTQIFRMQMERRAAAAFD